MTVLYQDIQTRVEGKGCIFDTTRTQKLKTLTASLILSSLNYNPFLNGLQMLRWPSNVKMAFKC